MKAWLVLPLLALAGCSINKLVPPPYAGAIIDHERFFGINAKIPYGGSAVVEVQLGWGSHVWVLLPVATNAIYAPKLSDTFSVGSTLNPFDTQIKEYLQTGWEGSTMPSPAMRIFHPTLKETNSPPEIP